MSESTEPVPFAMPAPHKGQAVIYYPNGVVAESNASIGYVTLVGRANIELNSHGMLRESVCHKDDPVVKENIYARKSGVWDFSTRDREIDQRIADLQAKNEQLEARLAALEAGTKPAK
jgi:hypothetical protein